MMVVHVYGKTHHLPVTVERDAHHMAGKNNRKVKNVVTRLQNPPTADAPNLARWPHPFDTANQMMKGKEEVHVLVQEKGEIDEAAFEAFKASHPAQGKQGWWDNSQPFSRKDAPQQAQQEAPKRARSPPAAAQSEQCVTKKRALLRSPQLGVVAAMLKQNM